MTHDKPDTDEPTDVDDEYTAEDFRTGNFDPADPFTPITRQQAANLAEMFESGESPEEIRQASIEQAIDRLENPDDYTAAHGSRPDDPDRDLLAVLNAEFSVVPPETRGE